MRRTYWESAVREGLSMISCAVRYGLIARRVMTGTLRAGLYEMRSTALLEDDEHRFRAATIAMHSTAE